MLLERLSRRYRNLFALPAIRSAMASSMLGRVPIGIAGFAILLTVQHKTGSFAQAGAVSALYVLGLASVAPLIGRAIDRIGPAPVLRVCAMVYPVMLIALIALVDFRVHPLIIAVSAYLAGAALPPITICMRSLYPRVIDDPALLQSAYSIDSVIVETVFVLGPALVALFVAYHAPAGAVVLAAISGGAGALLFMRAHAIRNWEIRASIKSGRWGVFGVPALLTVFAATVFYSIAFGLYEVGVTAFAAKRGTPAAAGIALALASAGSAVGALAYGARHWQASLRTQLLIALGLMAAGSLLLAPMQNIYLFMLGNIIAGLPMASVIATQSLLVSRLAPTGMIAESFTWAGTCLLGGISGGIALAGLLAEYIAPGWIIASAAGSTVIAGLIACAIPRVNANAEAAADIASAQKTS